MDQKSARYLKAQDFQREGWVHSHLLHLVLKGQVFLGESEVNKGARVALASLLGAPFRLEVSPIDFSAGHMPSETRPRKPLDREPKRSHTKVNWQRGADLRDGEVVTQFYQSAKARVSHAKKTIDPKIQCGIPSPP